MMIILIFILFLKETGATKKITYNTFIPPNVAPKWLLATHAAIKHHK